jgi:hypothetical protein
MTTAGPLARYGAMISALTRGLAPSCSIMNGTTDDAPVSLLYGLILAEQLDFNGPNQRRLLMHGTMRPKHALGLWIRGPTLRRQEQRSSWQRRLPGSA